MTPSQQATLEQAAREWLHKWESMDGARFFVGGDRESFFEAFIALLAAQRAAVLEEAAQRLEQEAEDWDKAISGTFKEAARIIRQQAQEQRP